MVYGGSPGDEFTGIIIMTSSSIADLSEIILELGLSGTITEEERAIVQTSLIKATGAIVRYLKYSPLQQVYTQFYPNLNLRLQNRIGIWEVDNNNAFLRRLAQASTSELQVQNIPVRSADIDDANAIDLRIDFGARSGTVSGSFAAGTQKIEGQDFWPNYDMIDSGGRSVCRDGIIRSHGRWPDEPGSVKIVYVGGYTQAELHGQDALLDASPIMDAIIDESVRRVQKAFTRRKHAMVGFAGGAFIKEKLGDYSYELGEASVNLLVGGGYDLLPETKEKIDDFVNYGIALAS